VATHHSCTTNNRQNKLKNRTMTIGKELLKELILEAAVTRRYLDNVPFDKLDYKPIEKSETLGRLAIHVAEIIAWWVSVVETDKLDFIDFEPKEIKSKSELLSYFDGLLADAKTSLTNVKDEEFSKAWSMTHGDDILFTLPKKQVARLFCMNHLVHHRSQLGVYLRLLEIPVPATYGPSADDGDVILINSF
jgi:uncharacterized damage-inducible protein DinB